MGALVARVCTILAACFGKGSLAVALLGPFMAELGVGCGNAFYIYVPFPFIPWFICDFFFCLVRHLRPPDPRAPGHIGACARGPCAVRGVLGNPGGWFTPLSRLSSRTVLIVQLIHTD